MKPPSSWRNDLVSWAVGVEDAARALRVRFVVVAPMQRAARARVAVSFNSRKFDLSLEGGWCSAARAGDAR